MLSDVDKEKFIELTLPWVLLSMFSQSNFLEQGYQRLSLKNLLFCKKLFLIVSLLPDQKSTISVGSPGWKS
jgi:hypothetical protein